MSLLSSSLALLVSVNAIGFAPPEEPKSESPPPNPPTVEQVRASIEKSLPFLAEGGEQWRLGKTPGGQNGRICVTCHQIPFTIWSHNEAALRGFKFDAVKHEDLTKWTLEWCASDKNASTNKHTGGHIGTMNQLILGRSAAPPDKFTAETYTLFAAVLGERQLPDGNWHEGNQIGRPEGPREADECDTMWSILGLTGIEQMGEVLSPETRANAAKNRDRAIVWLKASSKHVRSDWLALRALVHQKLNETKPADDCIAELLAQQNADGGWPLARGETSHPLVTGQALYALSHFGRDLTDPAVARAAKYLLDLQQPDGSWKANSRREPEKINAITIHWATGWATIGLVRVLPK